MNIIIDIMVIFIVYMIGYKTGMNYMNNLWSAKLKEIINKELERRQSSE